VELKHLTAPSGEHTKLLSQTFSFKILVVYFGPLAAMMLLVCQRFEAIAVLTS